MENSHDNHTIEKIADQSESNVPHKLAQTSELTTSRWHANFDI
jgi:hypothetical protein